jgi:hypothetical protein
MKQKGVSSKMFLAAAFSMNFRIRKWSMAASKKFAKA